MRLLVTGGAGFVGGNVAVALAETNPDWQITAMDNLRRRGSELNLPRLRKAGVGFVLRRRTQPRRPPRAPGSRRDRRMLG
jgi:nucleoside-diphosphate-sugar epimerase